MVSRSFLDRRRVLKGLAALGGATLLSACVTRGGADRSSWLPGLQLYTLGDAPKQDLEGTLRQVAAIGYRAVELPAPYDRTAQQLRNALNETGLVCPSVHVLFQPRPGMWDLARDLAKLAEHVKAIGASYVVVPGPSLPDRIRSRSMGTVQPDFSEIFGSLTSDDWKQTADLLNEKGSILAKFGLHIAYHNHDMEFRVLPDGKTGFDILVERTDPGHVDFELDTGWVSAAGRNPIELVERLGRRVRLMHLKDTKETSKKMLELASTDIGTGIVDWERLIPAIRRAEIQHLFVEQEPPFRSSRMDSVRIAYDFLSEAFAKAS